MPLNRTNAARPLLCLRKSTFCSYTHPTVQAARALRWGASLYAGKLQLQMADIFQQLVLRADMRRAGEKHIQWEVFKCGCLSHCKRAFN